MTILRLEDREIVSEWSLPYSPSRCFMSEISSDLKRTLVARFNGKDEDAEIAEVFEAGNPEPIASIDGCPLDLSPDGRFFVIRNTYNTGPVTVIEAESGKPCAVVPHQEDKRAEILFSPDSRHLAVYLNKRLTLVTLEGDYPKKDILLPEDTHYYFAGPFLAFSPDGKGLITQLLLGEAILFDTESGRVVRRFVEPERFVDPRERTWDSDEGIWEQAQHLAGSVWDRIWGAPKVTPLITGAFCLDGSQVITMAAGQILRVWDAASGEAVRTIRTGLPARYNNYGYIHNEFF